MSFRFWAGIVALAALGGAPAFAECSNPDALGVSRVLPIDSTGGFQVGSIQYHHQKLPLAPKEVVLTFDDGPSPEATVKVLEALAAECTKATFFIVGSMAKAHPETLRREFTAGHTIATHTLSHANLQKLSFDLGAAQIDRGIAEVTAVLGVPPAPFFRFPLLGKTKALTEKLDKANVGVLSADVVGDDWIVPTGEQVRDLVLQRLEQRGGGIILLHDIKHTTAAILPELLHELKVRGYKIVHLVPAEGSEAVATGPEPEKVITLASKAPPKVSEKGFSLRPSLSVVSSSGTTKAPVAALKSLPPKLFLRRAGPPPKANL